MKKQYLLNKLETQELKKISNDILLNSLCLSNTTILDELFNTFKVKDNEKSNTKGQIKNISQINFTYSLTEELIRRSKDNEVTFEDLLPHINNNTFSNISSSLLILARKEPKKIPIHPSQTKKFKF